MTPERLSEEPRLPVRLPHGTGRLPDGKGVKGERPPQRLATREVVYAWIIFAIVVVGILIGTLR